ncbi:MAG: hypothetical protein P4L53_01935 [Candidatus Obscuribacterales bacterium]|nr:hypothetical protein [Candidatus Obscuribacterales bacterium]
MPKFDLEKTQELERLFQVDRKARDEMWYKSFFSAVVDASLVCGHPQVVIGPDQFPYFHLGLPSRGAFEPFCISHILDNALSNVFGVCIFSSLENTSAPEYVFSYGDLLSYKLYGTFAGDPAEVNTRPSPALKQEVLTEARDILVGQPNEDYLPTISLKALGDFMRKRLGHPDPKICLILDTQLKPSKNLAVNVGIDDVGGDPKQLQSIFGVISWFLPRNYGLMSVPSAINQSALAALP